MMIRLATRAKILLLVMRGAAEFKLFVRSGITTSCPHSFPSYGGPDCDADITVREGSLLALSVF